MLRHSSFVFANAFGIRHSSFASLRPCPEDIVAQSQDTRHGLTYYNFELANHTLVSATVFRR